MDNLKTLITLLKNEYNNNHIKLKIKKTKPTFTDNEIIKAYPNGEMDITLLGQKYKGILRDINVILDFIFKHRFSNYEICDFVNNIQKNNFYLCSIASTNKELLKYYRTQPNVTKYIKRLKDLSVIADIVTDNFNYRPGYWGKFYVINMDNLIKLKKISKKYKIKKVKSNNLDIKLKENKEIDYSNSIFDYDVYMKHFEMVQEINKTFTNVNDIISYTPKFKDNGTITLRHYCPLSSMIKAERELYLNNKYGKDNWVGIDVNGSIPRLAYYIKHKEIYNKKQDIYTFCFKPIFDKYGLTFDDDNRDIFKEIFMQIFFSKDSNKKIIHNITRFCLLGQDDKFKEDCNRFMNDCIDRVREVFGSSNGELFYIESNIYIEMLYEFAVVRNYDVTNIYDAFYFWKDTVPDDFYELYENIMIETINNLNLK